VEEVKSKKSRIAAIITHKINIFVPSISLTEKHK